MRQMEYTNVLIVAAVLLSVECTPHGSPTADASLRQTGTRPHKLHTRHLPNAYRIHKRVISGGKPGSEAAFRELRALGVKTVISVDGARPQVELARKHGLRYVHLPHGYDGVPEERARQLAKAVRDLPGPVYIHCHHGKHRSPAAAAVACVGAGLLRPTDAISVLRVAGTSKHYRGLYDSAKKAQRFDDALLDALKAEFPETTDVPPMAEAMVSIEHTYDNLKAIQKAGWKSPLGHPDLDPAHEALLLREHFTELLRTETVRRQPPTFQQMLRVSRDAAAALESGLRDVPASRQRPSKVVAESFSRISLNCKACHARFRDVPLSQKESRNH